MCCEEIRFLHAGLKVLSIPDILSPSNTDSTWIIWFCTTDWWRHCCGCDRRSIERFRSWILSSEAATDDEGEKMDAKRGRSTWRRSFCSRRCGKDRRGRVAAGAGWENTQIPQRVLSQTGWWSSSLLAAAFHLPATLQCKAADATNFNSPTHNCLTKGRLDLQLCMMNHWDTETTNAWMTVCWTWMVTSDVSPCLVNKKTSGQTLG